MEITEDVILYAFWENENYGSAELTEEVSPDDIGVAADEIKLVVIENTPDETVQEQMKASLPENAGFLYLSVDLLAVTDGEETEIEETEKPIEIKLTIPDELKPDENSAESRSYKVVRSHGSDIDVLDAEYKAGSLTFLTNKFSDYAIAYIDLPYGDANGDGDVTMADLLLLKQYMVKVPGKSIYKGAADVTADEDVTMADLLRLKQYMVKVPGIELGK